MLQKQQQTVQMMSNVSKMLHDTMMAMIRKIGCSGLLILLCRRGGLAQILPLRLPMCDLPGIEISSVDRKLLT